VQLCLPVERQLTFTLTGRCVVLENGEVVKQGTSEELRDEPSVTRTTELSINSITVIETVSAAGAKPAALRSVIPALRSGTKVSSRRQRRAPRRSRSR
jgi:ABC-type glutathione transport system ATPase component